MKKKVLVTGGARGIGRAIVEELAQGDYEIIATYNSSKDAAEQLAREFANVTFKQINLEDREELDKFINGLSHESIDVLVNNAGIWLGRPFENMTTEELYQQIDLNFTASARLIHGLLPALKQSKAPLIIQISSQAAHPVYPGEAMYSATKAAVSVLTEILRAELNPTNIRLTTFEPWGVNTYGIEEPSGMVLPSEMAQTIRYVIEAPDHLQLEKIGIAHVKQWRGNFPDWIEK